MRNANILIASLVAVSGTAFAQDEAPAPAPVAEPATPPAADGAAVPAPIAEAAPAAVAGTTYVTRGLTVGAGTVQVVLPVVLNLSKNQVLKPVSIPLDLRYGVTDQLDVFLSHDRSRLPLAFREGGVCIGGRERGCIKFYDNLNVGAELSFLKNAGIELSAIGAFEVRSLDRMHLAFELGIGFKYRAGPVAIKTAPGVGVGINKRNEQMHEFIAVPVQVALQATPELAVFADTGVFGPRQSFSRTYAVPVGVGAAYAVMPMLDVGAEVMLPLALCGNEDNEPFDTRTLMIYGAFRMK